MSEEHPTKVEQKEQVVNGPQTNIAGDVHGPVLSGEFDGPVAAGNGDAVDLRGAQGTVYKPSGPVFVNSVIQFLDEKLFKRLGLEQRLGFGLLVVLIIGGFLGLYLVIRSKQPTQISGSFRIAVAGFTEVRNGRPYKSKLGMEIAQQIYVDLERRLMDQDITFVVWGPDQVGSVKGKNRDERAIEAEQLANHHSADMVVYGVIDTTSFYWEISPEFYVAAKNFYEAEEIISTGQETEEIAGMHQVEEQIAGMHQLGETFKVIGGNTTETRVAINDELIPRVNILSRITIGLVRFSLKKFEKALYTFLELENECVKIKGDAEVKANAEEQTGPETEICGLDVRGKELLYLLIGNSGMKAKELDLAESYYQKALTEDSEYSRAYVGLAGVYYLRGLEYFEFPNVQDIDPYMLHQAIVKYEKALAASYQPPLSDIATKVHLGLGQCYTALALYGEQERVNDAIEEFRQVIEEYGDGDNPRVREFAAEAYARLGFIYAVVGYNDVAIANYKSAVQLLYDYPERQLLYEGQIQKLEENTNDVP